MIEKNLLTFTFFIWMLSLVSGLSLEEVTNLPCTPWHFRCDNNRCTLKHYRCDNDRDCSDGSDERNCHLSLFDLPRFERFEKVRMKAAKWLIKQVEMEPKLRSWGYSPVRVSIALYIHNETYFYHGNRTGNVISSELQIELLSKLAHQNADEMDLAELASFINALIAVCLDPREFYGVDLVAKLRSRVDAVDEVSPAPFIALCNAGDLLTSDDVRKLITVFDSGSRALWTDMQAMALMGLICAARQKENITSTLYRYSAKLKLPINSTTGILDNIKTTGLVLQALIAAGDTFDTTMKMSDIFWKLSEGQNADGSFGDVWNTYYILPIFSWKSLINITSAHCTEDSRRERRIYKEWLGEKKKIQYSLWLGTSKYMTTTLTLNVPVEETFFSTMKVATQINEKYSFETSMRNGKPYVYSISEVEDDPETGNLWYLFRVRNETTTELINISPIDYMPENDVHLVYWFREVPSYT